ncbi:hypothetical protein [Nocardioides pinisoli]|uniref:Uncharacterized protein n=1 Tax=Nocardioides pinisoli TaxID=2950279 RepID=A0ABT1KUC4_9ACTN|nr:hypothetical protein [Nocardioides pinisoli]MCP3420911.1 hypothetical protein [Nocardioides pinisoli]
MSDQLTSQSRSNESGITRRTALRGAAWSASAVTVVVAAPAHANTSGVTPTGSASTSGSTRDGATLNLKSQFTAGPQTVSGLTAVVTVSTGTIASATTPAGWTRTGLSGSTATYTYNGNVAGGAVAAFAPVVTLSTNPTTSVTSTINFTWTKTGSALVSIPLAYVAPAATITNAVARKYSEGSTKHVEFKLGITNSSTTQTLAPLSLDFTWSADVVGNRATQFTVLTQGRTWNTTLSDLTAVLAGAGLAPGQTLSVTADFVNPKDNASGWVNVEVFSGSVSAFKSANVTY